MAMVCVAAAAGFGVAAGICVRVGVAAGVGFSAGVGFAAGVAAAAGVGVAATAPPALWRAGRRMDLEGPDRDDDGESLRMRPCRDAPPRAKGEKPHNVEGRRCRRWPPRTAKWRDTN